MAYPIPSTSSHTFTPAPVPGPSTIQVPGRGPSILPSRRVKKEPVRFTPYSVRQTRGTTRSRAQAEAASGEGALAPRRSLRNRNRVDANVVGEPRATQADAAASEAGAPQPSGSGVAKEAPERMTGKRKRGRSVHVAPVQQSASGEAQDGGTKKRVEASGRTDEGEGAGRSGEAQTRRVTSVGRSRILGVSGGRVRRTESAAAGRVKREEEEEAVKTGSVGRERTRSGGMKRRRETDAAPRKRTKRSEADQRGQDVQIKAEEEEVDWQPAPGTSSSARRSKHTAPGEASRSRRAVERQPEPGTSSGARRSKHTAPGEASRSRQTRKVTKGRRNTAVKEEEDLPAAARQPVLAANTPSLPTRRRRAPQPAVVEAPPVAPVRRSTRTRNGGRR